MKQAVIFLLLAGIVGLGAGRVGRDAAVQAGVAKNEYKNLKVLRKDISSRELQGIMADDFEDGLGVSCGFCHAAAKGGHGLDFASDAKPEKSIARRMMRMTLALNRKFFAVRKPAIGSAALTITCSTCHKGQPFPDGEALR